jgi:hypothetical protein
MAGSPACDPRPGNHGEYRREQNPRFHFGKSFHHRSISSTKLLKVGMSYEAVVLLGGIGFQPVRNTGKMTGWKPIPRFFHNLYVILCSRQVEERDCSNNQRAADRPFLSSNRETPE